MLKFFSKQMNNKKGFTLIELIVVIAILGILAAIAIPRFTGMRHEATVKAEGSTAASILSAARVQEADLGVPVAGGTPGSTVSNGTPAAAGLDGKIDKKYMILPTGDTVPTYTIMKTNDLYVITWTSKATGFTKQTLTEGQPFKGNQS